MEPSHRSLRKFGPARREKIDVEVDRHFWTKIEGKSIGNKERKTEEGKGRDYERVPGFGKVAIQLGPEKTEIWREEVQTANQFVDEEARERFGKGK